LEQSLDRGWITRAASLPRAVTVTPAGRQALTDLGSEIALTDPTGL
jgi:hypothetical protein